MSAGLPVPSRPLRWREVGRIQFLRLLRRKDALVPLLLMTVFGVGAAAFQSGGFDNPAAGTMLLNLGMTLAWASAHILAVAGSTGQVGPEIDARTLHPLLARPLERADFLLGRWLACWFSCGAVALLLLIPGWFMLPRLEEYSAPLLLQSILLQQASLAAACALGLWLSLVFSRPLALVAAGAVVFASGWPAGLLARQGAAGAWLAEYLPDFGRLNLITRYTDGIGALPAGSLLGALAYAALWAMVFLLLACHRFRRMPL